MAGGKAPSIFPVLPDPRYSMSPQGGNSATPPPQYKPEAAKPSAPSVPPDVLSPEWLTSQAITAAYAGLPLDQYIQGQLLNSYTEPPSPSDVQRLQGAGNTGSADDAIMNLSRNGRPRGSADDAILNLSRNNIGAVSRGTADDAISNLGQFNKPVQVSMSPQALPQSSSNPFIMAQLDPDNTTQASPTDTIDPGLPVRDVTDAASGLPYNPGDQLAIDPGDGLDPFTGRPRVIKNTPEAQFLEDAKSALSNPLGLAAASGAALLSPFEQALAPLNLLNSTKNAFLNSFSRSWKNDPQTQAFLPFLAKAFNDAFAASDTYYIQNYRGAFGGQFANRDSYKTVSLTEFNSTFYPYLRMSLEKLPSIGGLFKEDVPGSGTSIATDFANSIVTADPMARASVVLADLISMVPMSMRANGFNKAATQWERLSQNIAPSAVRMASYTGVPADQLSDFAMDLYSDPMKINKLLLSGTSKILKLHPAYQTMVNDLMAAESSLGKEGARAKIALMLGGKAVNAAKSVIPKAAPLLDDASKAIARIFTMRQIKPDVLDAINAGKSVMYGYSANTSSLVKSFRQDVMSTMQKYKNTGLSKLDQWVFQHVDAGSPQAMYSSKAEALKGIWDDLKIVGITGPKQVAEINAKIIVWSNKVNANHEKYAELLTKYGSMNPETAVAYAGQHMRHIFEEQIYSKPLIFQKMLTDIKTALAPKATAKRASDLLSQQGAIVSEQTYGKLAERQLSLQIGAGDLSATSDFVRPNPEAFPKTLGHPVVKLSSDEGFIHVGAEPSYVSTQPVNTSVPHAPADNAPKTNTPYSYAGMGDEVIYRDASGKEVRGTITKVDPKLGVYINDVPAATNAKGISMSSRDGTVLPSNQSLSSRLVTNTELQSGASLVRPSIDRFGRKTTIRILDNPAGGDANSIRAVSSDLESPISIDAGSRNYTIQSVDGGMHSLPMSSADDAIAKIDSETAALSAYAARLRSGGRPRSFMVTTGTRRNYDLASSPMYDGSSTYGMKLLITQNQIEHNDALKRWYQRLKTNGVYASRGEDAIMADLENVTRELESTQNRINTATPGMAIVDDSKQLRILNNQKADLDLEMQMFKRQMEAKMDDRFIQNTAELQAAKAQGLVRLDGRRYGVLDGQYVDPRIQAELDRADYGIRTNSAIAEVGKRAVSLMKYTQSVLNPAVFTRNLIGNHILTEAALRDAGISILDPRLPLMFKDSAEALVDKSGRFRKYVDELDQLKPDMLHTGSEGTELIRMGRKGISPIPETALESAAMGTGQFVGAAWRAPGIAYQGAEHQYKLFLYSALRELKGMEPRLAAQTAQKFLFDYADVPTMVDIARQYGLAPFATFPYKATGIFLNTLVNDPALIDRVFISHGHANDIAFRDSDPADETSNWNQYQLLLKTHSFLGNQPAAWPIGKDARGNLRVANFTNVLPMGFGLGGQNGLLDAAQALSQTQPFGIPLGATAMSGVPFTDIEGFNANPSIGNKPFFTPGMSDTEKNTIKFQGPMSSFLPKNLLVPGRLGPDGPLVNPGMDTLEAAIHGRAAGSKLSDPQQDAFAAILQGAFGLPTYAQGGKGNPAAEDLPGRDEQQTQRQQEIIDALDAPLNPAKSKTYSIADFRQDTQEIIQDGFKNPKFVKDARSKYPGIYRVSDLTQVQKNFQDAMDRYKNIQFQDFHQSPERRVAMMRNQAKYLFAIAEQRSILVRLLENSGR